MPIESLGYANEPAVVEAGIVPVEALAPEGRVPLERGFDDYRLLVGRSREESAPVAAAPEPSALDIRALCYRGRAALERAAEVRGEIAERLMRREALPSVEALVAELLDLVPLALEPAD